MYEEEYMTGKSDRNGVKDLKNCQGNLMKIRWGFDRKETRSNKSKIKKTR